MQKELAETHAETQRRLAEAAQAERSAERLREEAETLLLQARTALLASCGQAHASSARCLFLLALVYEQRGPGGRNYKSVIKMLDAALLVFLRSPLLLSLSLSTASLAPLH